MVAKIFPENKTDLITAYVIERPELRIKITEIAKALKFNKGTVSLAVNKLNVIGIVKGKKVDLQNPLTRSLKVLVTITKLIDRGTVRMLKGYAIAAGLYGSSAKGTDTSDSDIDLWIKPKTDLSQLEVSALTRKVSSMLNRQVQIIILDKAMLEKIKKENINFYYALVFGSIILFGEKIE